MWIRGKLFSPSFGITKPAGLSTKIHKLIRLLVRHQAHSRHLFNTCVYRNDMEKKIGHSEIPTVNVRLKRDELSAQSSRHPARQKHIRKESTKTADLFTGFQHVFALVHGLL
jgi:hypothetical protein